jgi:hypothetical protein
MTGTTSEVTAGYLRHHLALADRSDTLFSDDAIAPIHKTSRGDPPEPSTTLPSSPCSPASPPARPSPTSSSRAAVTEVTTE